MTHYGPSPPPHDPTILGLAGDGTSVVLWLSSHGGRIEKEMEPHEAIDLARRLLIEAAPLLKRGE
jgi:hypothetical protein